MLYELNLPGDFRLLCTHPLAWSLGILLCLHDMPRCFSVQLFARTPVLAYMILASGLKDSAPAFEKIQNIQRIVASILQKPVGQEREVHVALDAVLDSFPIAFRGSTQEDACEFMSHILEVVFDDQHELKFDNRPNAILTLEFTHVLECNCGDRRETCVEENMVSISITNDQQSSRISVQEMIARLALKETMDEPVACPKCKVKATVTKQMLCSKISPLLIVHIKCFDNERRKLFPGIELDRTLSIELIPHGSVNMALTAVVYHIGPSIQRGHFIIRFQGHGGRWFEADDSAVAAVDGPQLSRNKTVPYILVYSHGSQEAIHGALSSALSSLGSGLECFPLIPRNGR